MVKSITLKNILVSSLVTLVFFGIAYTGTQFATAATPSAALENPLKDIDTIDGLLYAILNIIMILMIPIIVFFIIYAGFKYVTARGNASQVEEASQTLLYAIIGGVLILGAVAIAGIIKSVVDAF